MDRLDAAQEVLVEQADVESDPDARKALLSAEEALGQLKVEIADEGTNYTSGITRIRLLGAKFSMQTVQGDEALPVNKRKALVRNIGRIGPGRRVSPSSSARSWRVHDLRLVLPTRRPESTSHAVAFVHV